MPSPATPLAALPSDVLRSGVLTSDVLAVDTLRSEPLRIAIVTESFLPTVNGVSNSVARVTEQLVIGGHEVMIIAPGKGPERFGDSKVLRTPAVPLPGYQSIPVGMPTTTTTAELEAFDPDVVHVGGPVALGAWGLASARRMQVPAVAVYQTDFPRFARHYKVAAAEGLVWRWLRRIHSSAQLTLAPSRAAAWDLRRHGIPRVALWGRGVDVRRFTPANRDERLHRDLTAGRGALIGYIGRLAPEKNVALLKGLSAVAGARLVVVGDGPDRPSLQQQMPDAVFTGYKGGAELARLFATLDVFVHTGAHETFCQTVQESLASGVPVVAPAIGGPLDLVRHGHNGVLYRPEDERALRQAVRRLVADPQQRQIMAANARPGVLDRTWAALTTELVAYYHHAIDHHAIDHHAIDHHAIDHHAIDHHAIDHHAIDHQAIDHQAIDHQAIDHQAIHRQAMLALPRTDRPAELSAVG